MKIILVALSRFCVVYYIKIDDENTKSKVGYCHYRNLKHTALTLVLGKNGGTRVTKRLSVEAGRATRKLLLEVTEKETHAVQRQKNGKNLISVN